MLKDFLDAGGYLAWGIVPTSDAIASITDAEISTLLKERVAKLHNLTKSDLVYTQSLISPSCGTGSRTVEEATKIFQLTMRVKEAMVSNY
jgi:hypothetical protein